jgi:hypothetical protein
VTISEVKVGDTVIRWLAGTLPMKLIVSAVTDNLIICGPWTFDRQAGFEIDEQIGWGVKGADGKIMSGSFLTLE